jgi:hypothetical protein
MAFLFFVLSEDVDAGWALHTISGLTTRSKIRKAVTFQR